MYVSIPSFGRNHSPNLPDEVRLYHFGATDGVTGSCHLLEVAGLKILLDCGLFQGADGERRNLEGFPFDPSSIDFLFLSHAHIDHIGRVPKLIHEGFKGKIICSIPTKELIMPVIEDGLRLGLGGLRLRSSERERLYHKVEDLSRGFQYDKRFELKRGVSFKLKRAGHILGSAFLIFYIPLKGKRYPFKLVFSGDLGAPYTPILPAPSQSYGCDFLILESTYGDRVHEGRRERLRALEDVLRRCLADDGKVFIPAFSLGRTQELLYEISALKRSGRIGDVPIILDSPLGFKITDIYERLERFWDDEAKRRVRRGDFPLVFKGFYSTRSFGDHRAVLDMGGPAIFIAGSGMCSGGRILDHLKLGLADERNDILFVSYQAEGTPGREILRYAEKRNGYVWLEGKRFYIRAKVHQLHGYSAHADQRTLLRWVRAMSKRPAEVALVHGEGQAKMHLKEAMDGGGNKEEG